MVMAVAGLQSLWRSGTIISRSIANSRLFAVRLRNRMPLYVPSGPFGFDEAWSLLSNMALSGFSVPVGSICNIAGPPLVIVH